jgi:hypothetical protein
VPVTKGDHALTRLLNHVRSNAIAYLALFFALGGGGAWAASSLPRAASTPQARAASADPEAGGHIFAWAHVAANGKIQGGSRGVRLWEGAGGTTGRYGITWRRLRISGSCGAVVSPGSAGSDGSPRTAMALIRHAPFPRGLSSFVFVQTFDAQGHGAPAPFTLEVVC